MRSSATGDVGHTPGPERAQRSGDPNLAVGGVEFIHVLAGVLEYGYGSKRYTLRPGDTMQFRGDVAHGPTALIDLPVRFLSLKVHDTTG